MSVRTTGNGPSAIYSAWWSEEDGAYVGKCSSFPSLSWLAPTITGAMDGIAALVAEVQLETKQE